MPDFSQLSRRERQIMEILFAQGEATVREIQQQLPEPPTVMAIRRMVSILEEKGEVLRRKAGREMVYRPAEAREKAGVSALRGVLRTFFGGSLESAVAAHLEQPEETLSGADLARLRGLIDAARHEKTNS